MEMEGVKHNGNTQTLRAEGSPPPKVVDFALNGVAPQGNGPKTVATPESQSSPFPTRLIVDDEFAEDEQHHAGGSDYAMSTYPKVHASHRVEYPYQKDQRDDGTM